MMRDEKAPDLPLVDFELWVLRKERLNGAEWSRSRMREHRLYIDHPVLHV